MTIGPLHLFQHTNDPRAIMVAALHHSWSITWRWLLWYYLPSGFKFNWVWFSSPGGQSLTVTTPLGKLDFQSQPNLKYRPEDYEKPRKNF